MFTSTASWNTSCAKHHASTYENALGQECVEVQRDWCQAGPLHFNHKSPSKGLDGVTKSLDCLG